MHTYPLAVLAGGLPLICIHLSYLVAASYGHVPWCIPHIDSCTSISATGRHAPEFFLFKFLMIPGAVLIGVYWFCCFYWLRALGTQRRLVLRAMLVLGVFSAVWLTFYSVILGAIGDTYQLLRRISVTSFFGFLYLSQLLLTYLLSQLPDIVNQHRRRFRDVQWVTVTLFVTGIGSVLLSLYDYGLYKRTDDAFEWVFTTLVCLHGLAVAVLWKHTGFKLQVRLQPG